jgi:hypothetical protein
MRVEYVGLATSAYLMAAATAFAATTTDDHEEWPVDQTEEHVVVLDPPDEDDPNVVVDVPPSDCAADGPGCPQFVPSPGDGISQVPLPPAILLLAAGVAALAGLGRRGRSAGSSRRG